MSDRRDGFTLIELSIVVVIVGLIIGASVFAWTLMRQAEVRAVINEVDRINQAVGMFKAKYNALPGDMYNATDFWGVDVPAALSGGPSNACSDTYSTTTPHTATCNGNGNGSIGDATPGTCIWSAHFETFRVWQHLSNAGMIDGIYTGTTGPSGISFTDVIPGVNVPLSATRSGGYAILDGAGMTCAYYFPPPPNTHALFFGGRTPGNFPLTPILTATEALALDTKIDDGLPGYGQVQAPMNAERITNGVPDPNCLTNDVQSTSAYNVSDTNNTCTLILYFNP